MGAFHLLHTPFGIRLVSFVLGLGIASLFFSACSGSGCLRFVSPVLEELTQKIYPSGVGDEKGAKDCVQYELKQGECKSHLATVAAK